MDIGNLSKNFQLSTVDRDQEIQAINRSFQNNDVL